MGKTSLRKYNEEIDALIDAGNYKTGIEYAKHILKFYPKHVDTYRLLGKAFLESERYTDAIDIFQRLLSCIPNDYIAHIGMSIIREDESNLDAAIFHMERAYEVQPTNQALLKELKRLYGVRDGIEPTKLRLTTGALAKMYAHGDLYSQAIAELLAALVEDENRPDLMILLAEMYFKSNQVGETIEVCSSILHSLPYCFVANDLMARILLTDGKEMDAQRYLKRLFEIDPYIEHSDFPNENPNDVDDDAVLVDTFEFHFENEEDDPKTIATELPQSGSLLGNDWKTTFADQLKEDAIEEEKSDDSGEDDLPDWLLSDDNLTQLSEDEIKTESHSQQSATEAKELAEENENDAFDFLGSLESDDEIETEDDAAPTTIIEDDEANEEMDDWLQELQSPASTDASNEEDTDDDWLSRLGAIGEIAEKEEETANEKVEDGLGNEAEDDSAMGDFDFGDLSHAFGEEADSGASVIEHSDEDESDEDWLASLIDDDENASEVETTQAADDLFGDEKEDSSDAFDDELKGLVSEGNEAEAWLNQLASSADAQALDDDEDVDLSELEEDANVIEKPKTNLDWLDEMKKEAAANAPKNPKDAMNLLGDLGILDEFELDEAQGTDDRTGIGSDDENAKIEIADDALETNDSGDLSWLDDLAKDKNEENAAQVMMEDEGNDAGSASDGAIDDASADARLSEGLAWLDNLSAEGEISDDDLQSIDDADVAVNDVAESTDDEHSDEARQEVTEDAAVSDELNASLDWLDDLANGDVSDDDLISDGDSDASDDTDEFLASLSLSSTENEVEEPDEMLELEENPNTRATDELSWLEDLAKDDDDNDDEIVAEEADLVEPADILKTLSDDEERAEQGLAEGLSWLDDLANGDVSNDDLISDDDADDEEVIEKVNSTVDETIDATNDVERVESEADDLDWLNDLNAADGENEETEEDKSVSAPATLIEEDETSAEEGLAEGLSWLDDLANGDVSNDDLMSEELQSGEDKTKEESASPATIIDEREEDEFLMEDGTVEDANDLSWLDDLKDEEEKTPATIIEDRDDDNEVAIDDDELEALQDTATWKSSLTTPEEYSEEEINSIETEKEHLKLDEESPNVEEEVNSPSSSAWLEELEKQSMLSQAEDEQNNDSDEDWLEKFSKEEAEKNGTAVDEDDLSLARSLDEGKNWVEDIDLEKSQPISNNLSEDIPEWLSALNVSEKNWEETPSEDLDRLAEHTSAAWEPEFASREAVVEKAELHDKTANDDLETLLDDNGILLSAKTALKNDAISEAVEQFEVLIKRNAQLDAIIESLDAALERYPMNVELLQTIGDAYLRNDNLEQAMAYFSKAEKLLR